MKKYVMVYVDGLIVTDVVCFDDIEKAKDAFKVYTDIEYDAVYGENGNYDLLDENYDQTKIFEINMPDIYDEIADYIIKEVQENSFCSGFQYVVDFKDVHETFNKTLDDITNDRIVEALNNREEVADVELDTDGFDVVLYTDFAPNYLFDEEIQEFGIEMIDKEEVNKIVETRNTEGLFYYFDEDLCVGINLMSELKIKKFEGLFNLRDCIKWLTRDRA